MALMKSSINKRSVLVRGRKTSISLEDAFWDAMKDIASARGRSLGALIENIDAHRDDYNLSSAIRVFVLEEQLRINKQRVRH